MPLYRNTLTQSPANRLAYQDTIVRQLAAGAGVSVRSPLFPAP